MFEKSFFHYITQAKRVWIAVFVLFALMVTSYFVPFRDFFLTSMVLVQKSDPFDGTVYPIQKIPDWTKLNLSVSARKTLDVSKLAANMFQSLPEYKPAVLDPKLASASAQIDSAILNARSTYTVLYMGSYSQLWKENVGPHEAIDILAPIGTPVYAAANAVVVNAYAGKNGEGNCVILRHDSVPALSQTLSGQTVSGGTVTYYSAYQHLDSFVVQKGDKVKKGENIGFVGNTGNSTTPHLHFQIDKDNAPYHPFYTLDVAKAGLYTIHPLQWVKENLSSDVVFTDKPRPTANTASGTTVTNTTNTGTTTNPATDTSTTGSLSQWSTKTTDNATTVVKKETVATTDYTPTADGPFPDVASTHPHAAAITYLKDKQIINGYGDGTFQPNKTVTRAELAKILLLGMKKTLKTDITENPFSDISDAAWYKMYVLNAKDQGIVKGYDDGSFRPDQVVNRAESLKMVLQTAGVDIPFVPADPYTDVPSGSWFAAYAQYAKDKSLIDVTDNQLLPTQEMTRAEIAELLYRVLKS